LKLTPLILTFALVSALLLCLQPALCWSNGGYSADPANSNYGTHDWIAQHALDYLPAEEKQYITSNLQVYLFGTELPDLPKSQGGFGDTTKHHIYYSAEGALTDDASAKRAQAMYNEALCDLEAGNLTGAAEVAGAMTHYIADLAVFGHVMGVSTAWGTEVHHSDYETHVNSQTGSYSVSFSSYLQFDGALANLTASDAAKNFAYDTTFGGASGYGCVWMDQNYDWGNAAFSDRCGESLSLAVNAVADALHSLYVLAEPVSTVSVSPAPTPLPSVPEFSGVAVFGVVLLVSVVFVAVVVRKR